MESVMVFFAGLGIRLLLFVLLFAAFAVPVAAIVFAAQGVVSVRARVRGTVDAGGVFYKPGVAYTAAHAWVKRQWGRQVKVGLDDVARRVLAGVSSIALPPIGLRLREGDLIAAVRCGDRLVAIPSPVAGVIVERNRALTDHPSLFEREPYHRGWMLRVESDAPPAKGLHEGPEAKAWLNGESLRLSRLLEARLGLTAADGGALTGTPATLLSPEAWREVAEQFLRAA
ncbi:MAG TPA: glycine cleavage system protein H [Candidatus Polarisedimenticolaceae bacterium]|nr:glycine cleavage system protein H [Candidatus Polarisedimenticolaceae bacterium]